MIKSRYLLICLAAALVGCSSGGDSGLQIDATSGETLQTSLRAMSEGLSAERKAEFSSDLNAIFESVLVTGLVDKDELYADDTAWILDEDTGPVQNAKFTRLVQKGRTRLDGLTVKQTAKLANDARSHWYGITGSQIVAAQKTAEKTWNGYPSQILKLGENYETILPRVELANEKAAQAFKNYELSSLEVQKDQRLNARGSVEVTNITDRPAIEVRYRNRFEISGLPGYSVNSESILNVRDNPLQPGETRTFQVGISSSAILILRRDPEADQIPFPSMIGKHEPARITSAIDGFIHKGNLFEEFTNIAPSPKDLTFLSGYEERLARCVSNQAAAQKYYQDLGVLIPIMKELKGKPRDVDLEFPQNTAEKGEDGYYCMPTRPF